MDSGFYTMLALIVILFFPMILGGLFLGASKVMQRMPGGSMLLTRYEGLLFLVALCIPFSFVVADLMQRNGFALAGVAWPSVAGLPVLASLIISLLAGVVVGIALYYAELLWAVRTINRATKRNGATGGHGSGSREFVRRHLTREMPGETNLRRNQSLESFGRYMGLSTVICAMEELIWRGFVVSILSIWLPVSVLAVPASASMFAAHHLSFGLRTAAMKALCGLVWACMFVFTGSLLASFISHLTFQYFVWQRLERCRLREYHRQYTNDQAKHIELAA